MTRGNNKHILFTVSEDYEYYLTIFRKLKMDHPFDLYHYCLMPNHTHFLVRTNKVSDFSTFMKRLNLKFYYYYKKNHEWVGHFFQDRFKSQPVGKDEYFIQCGKYIELNPVRAGIVTDPGDYPFSSYNYYTKGFENDLITTDFIFENFTGSASDKQRKYQALIAAEVVESTYMKQIWGSTGQRYKESRKIAYRKRNINH